MGSSRAGEVGQGAAVTPPAPGDLERAWASSRRDPPPREQWLADMGRGGERIYHPASSGSQAWLALVVGEEGIHHPASSRSRAWVSFRKRRARDPPPREQWLMAVGVVSG